LPLVHRVLLEPSDFCISFCISRIAADCAKSFAGDDPAECRAYVKQLLATVSKGGLFALQDVEQSGGDSNHAARIALALALWNEALPPEGTPVETYLKARRCELPPSAASVLRFQSECFFAEHCFPAMIALMCDVRTNVPHAIQRTALNDDGSGKREMPDGMNPRMMLGIAKGAAVMLHPAAERIGIAEGIETALSANQIFNIPVWAALSAGGIAAFPVIPSIKHLTIFADYDKAGLQAARTCCWKYKKTGTEVQVRCPPNVDEDWNDHLTKGYDHAYHFKI
jgi:hypothetical protein